MHSNLLSNTRHTRQSLAIGTHTAEITINNQAGETTKQEWLFTVGVHDTSTLPLTADAVIISEIDLRLKRFYPA
jgi:hypothetical protein